MNIERYRPINIDKVIGQDMVKTGLFSMIKNYSTAPKWICIAGPKGTGRKTLARNYVRSIFCDNREKSLSNCGTCEVCRTILDNKAMYSEYDWSEIENIKNTNYILIKNFESCPRDKQSYLYSWWNNIDIKPTIILITESTENLIDDIDSISFILRTTLLTGEEIKKSLSDYNERDGSIMSEENIETIVRRSRGSLLTAHRLYEIYRTQDNETFKESLMSAREYYLKFLISCYTNKRDMVDKWLSMLKNVPLAYLKIDYEALIVEILKVYTKFEKPKDECMTALMNVCNNRVLDLYYIMNDKIIYNSFQNDDTFQAAMYVIYLKLIKKLR